MSVQHHFSGDEEIIKRFLDQGTGKADPFFPQGKLDQEDEGELAFAIAADLQNKVIRIDFNKTISWLAMDLRSAQELKNLLLLKIAELEICEEKR